MALRTLAASLLLAAASAWNVTGGCTGTSYDYFMMVLQWPPSLCQDGTFSCQSSNPWFTLHGLWPEDNNNNYPCTCTNEKFNQNAVQDLIDEMDTYWPSLNGGASSTFWAHEYEKHGTCAEDVLPTEHDFFSTTLALRSKYDPLVALQRAGITPSNSASYSKAKMHSAIRAYYGQDVQLSCDSSGLITGAVVCISKDLTIQACVGTNAQDQCSASTVTLPSSSN